VQSVPARNRDLRPQETKQESSVLGDLAVAHSIRAVYEEDLDEFLEELGLTEPLREGRLTCFACEKTVSRETLGCVFPLAGEIAICCDDPSCLEALPEEVIT